MSSNEIWQKFLDNIKEVISPTSFDIWFSEDETSLYSFKDDIATIVVTQEIYKKHLIENYMDLMLSAMRKAVGYDVTIDVNNNLGKSIGISGRINNVIRNCNINSTSVNNARGLQATGTSEV